MKMVRTRQRPFLVVIDVFLTLMAWVGLLFLLVRGLWPLLDTHAGGPRIDARRSTRSARCRFTCG